MDNQSGTSEGWLLILPSKIKLASHALHGIIHTVAGLDLRQTRRKALLMVISDSDFTVI